MFLPGGTRAERLSKDFTQLLSRSEFAEHRQPCGFLNACNARLFCSSVGILPMIRLTCTFRRSTHLETLGPMPLLVSDMTGTAFALCFVSYNKGCNPLSPRVESKLLAEWMSGWGLCRKPLSLACCRCFPHLSPLLRVSFGMLKGAGPPPPDVVFVAQRTHNCCWNPKLRSCDWKFSNWKCQVASRHTPQTWDSPVTGRSLWPFPIV